MGRPRDYYKISGMPDWWQIRIYHVRSKKLEEERAAADQGKMLVPVENALGKVPGKLPAVFWNGIPPVKADAAHMKYLLVARYREFMKKAEASHGRKMEIQEQFVLAYNFGQNGIFPDIFKVVGPVNIDMIYRWMRDLEASGNDPHVLADARGYHRAGSTIVTDEEMKILLAVMLSPNRIKYSEGIRTARGIFLERGIPAKPCDNSYRNAINRWKRNNYPQWVFCREGWKALNEECLMHIDRDYSQIKVGDIASADGHKFNMGMLDPLSGRERRMAVTIFEDMKSTFPLGWDISRNEDTSSITTAYYRACVTLGKIPRIIYCDNGKAFRKRVFKSIADFRQAKFTSMFERAGSEKVIYAWVRHGESKTVERLNGVIGEFERTCLTYSGNSIETKPARMITGEKLHKRLYDALTGGRLPTVEDVHTALAAYFEDYIRRPQSGRLRGRTPLEVFEEGRGPGLTEEELWRLKVNLLPSKIRTIHRDGVKMPWSDKKFYHGDMFGKKDHQVEVRYDLFDQSSILVFDRHGRFLYEARQKPLVHPAAAHLGTAEDQEELKRQIQIKRRQEKSVTGPLKQLLENEIIPEAKRRQEALGFGAGELPRLAPPAKPPEPEPDKWWEITDADRERADRSSGKREAWLKQRKEAQERAFNEHMAEEEIARSFDEALVLKAQGFELSEELQNVVFVYMRSEDYRQHREQWELRELVYREKYRKKTVGSMD